MHVGEPNWSPTDRFNRANTAIRAIHTVGTTLEYNQVDRSIIQDLGCQQFLGEENHNNDTQKH